MTSCEWCREEYKEYQSDLYKGYCSSCHAPPTDVYLYFKDKGNIERGYSPATTGHHNVAIGYQAGMTFTGQLRVE